MTKYYYSYVKGIGFTLFLSESSNTSLEFRSQNIKANSVDLEFFMKLNSHLHIRIFHITISVYS